MTSLPWLDAERDRLNGVIAADRLGHAPMILGSAGVGKRVFSEWLAARLLCLTPSDGEPCGRCASCRLLPEGTHPDFFRLAPDEGKTEIRVDPVRDFIDSITLTPSIGDRRVGMIDPADRMNRNAANALLKTLEEPSGDVWLILVTDRPDRLPVTIRSRCQVHRVALPERAAAERWLEAQHPQRTADERSLALTLADGAPLVADGWLAEGGLEVGLGIRDRLDALVCAGTVDPTVPTEWHDDPETTWTWLARWTEGWTRRLRTGTADGLGAAPPAGDPETLDRLHALWCDALAGRRMSGDPVRHDWLMAEWLRGWQGLAGRFPVAR